MRTKLLILMPLTLSGCWWTVGANDAGEEAFAAQAIEAVLGRKPKGAAEVAALADIAATAGREAMVRALFAEPDYVAYWTNVLADDLQVQRADAMQVDGDCVAPALLPEHLSDELADHVATAPPDAPFCYWSYRWYDWVFHEDIFWEAYDLAEAEYPFTRVDELPIPEPIVVDETWPEVEWKEVHHEGESLELDLVVEGSVASNKNVWFDDGKSVVAVEPDLYRWRDLELIVRKLECPPFNLTDVIEASVRADRLDAMYRGYLPVLATFPGTSNETELRKQLGTTFLDVYLDRDPTCMTCHTATYSTTDPRPLNGNWDRFFPVWYGLPVPLDAEGTVFSYDRGGPGDFVYYGDGGEPIRRQVGAFFRSDNHVAGGLRPWGYDDVCVTNPGRGFDGFQYGMPADPFGQDAVFAGVGPTTTAGVLDLVTTFSDAVSTYASLSFVVPDWASHRAIKGAPSSPTDPGCLGCHGGGNPKAPDLASRTPLMTDTRLFSVIRNGSGEMPPMAGTDAAAWNAVAWVRQTFPQTPAFQLKDRAHGFPFLVASNLTNQVLDEVLGEDATMAHHFPRNPSQANAASDFAGTFGVRFSLQDLLLEIVLSDAFNRKPPEDPSTTPYLLPMLPFPEAAVPPTSTPQVDSNANSEGDFVHKHSPSGLLHQTHHALGWPAPPIAGSSTAWPTQELMSELGRYTSRLETEREQFGIDTYLAWETAVGTCAKPDAVRIGDVNPSATYTGTDPLEIVGPDDWVDWIDVLVEDADANGYTWEQIAVAVKDRLLADPTLEKGESAAIEAFLGVTDLTSESPTDDGTFDDVDEALVRGYCGVLLLSPHYVLRGVGLVPALPSTLPTPSCLPSESCAEADFYDHYAATVEALGYTL